MTALPPRSQRRRRKDQPCDRYSGNLCGGFGGQTPDMTCWNCGWKRHEHGKGMPKRMNSYASGVRCVCGSQWWSSLGRCDQCGKYPPRVEPEEEPAEGEVDEQGKVEARTSPPSTRRSLEFPMDDEEDERGCEEAHGDPPLVGDMTVEQIAEHDVPIDVVIAVWLRHETDPQRRGALEDVLAVFDAQRTRRLPVNWTMVVPGLQVDDRPRCKATSTHRGQQVPCQKEEGHSGLCVWTDSVGQDELAWGTY